MFIPIITELRTIWLQFSMNISYVIHMMSPTIHVVIAKRCCEFELAQYPISTSSVPIHPNTSIIH